VTIQVEASENYFPVVLFYYAVDDGSNILSLWIKS